MLKLLISSFLVLFIGQMRGQKILEQDYSFLVSDGEIMKLHQSNDTLYELNCSIHRPCLPKPAKHYKILSVNEVETFLIVQLEDLDSIPLTTDLYSSNRYQILALEKFNTNKLGYLLFASNLTKHQLDTIQIESPKLKDKFFFTFFSDSYMKELSSFKKVNTKTDAEEIIETFKSEKFKTFIEKYAKSKVPDMYASGLSAEILNAACIEKGYNPIGAGRAINILMRK